MYKLTICLVVAWTREEWPIVMSDVFRVLKPGGYFQTIDIVRDDPGQVLDQEIMDFRYKSELRFSTLVYCSEASFC